CEIVVDEYIKRGRAREAADVLRKMADIDPGDLKIRSKLADLYIRDGDTARAVDEHVAIAEELNKKGHLAEALQVLEKGLKIDPKSDRLRLELARVHLIQKNYDKAAQHLEEAVQHSHRDPQLLARLGKAYLAGRSTEQAGPRDRGGGGDLQAPARDQPRRRRSPGADGARLPPAGPLRRGLRRAAAGGGAAAEPARVRQGGLPAAADHAAQRAPRRHAVQA